MIFKFANEDDKFNVLNNGPYLVFGCPLMLRAMPEYFDFSTSEMLTIPVWDKFPNLPIKCWSPKCLLKIASIIGKALQSDMLTSSMSRLSYARVLVEVNLLSDLPYPVDITLPNGNVLHQHVVYGTLPRFCKHCRVLGHLTSTCTTFSVVLSKPMSEVNNVNAHNSHDNVFQRLGPSTVSLVVDEQGISLPTRCGVDPMQPKIKVASDGWGIIRNNKSSCKHQASPTRSLTATDATHHNGNDKAGIVATSSHPITPADTLVHGLRAISRGLPTHLQYPIF